MAPRRAADEDDAEDEEEGSPAPPSARRRGRSSTRPPVRRWTDEEEPPPPGRSAVRARRGRADEAPPKDPVYFRARDSVYFEPLVALAVIVVLLVGLFAYTQNWPPMYVVESDSMQHGVNDQVGLINTGDLVLAQKASADQITSYVVGAQTGYTTYGEYGDVILYHPNGNPAGAPIIHRALIFIIYNLDGTYNFTQLQGQPCGNVANPTYSVSLPASACQTQGVPAAASLTLYHVGWRSVEVTVSLSSLGQASGFLTMGDNNFNPQAPNQGNPDQPFLSNLVQPGWIVGVARGMLPWFGAFKLLLEGNSGEVPSQSWAYMGLSLIGILVAAVLLHLLLRAEGYQDIRRKRARESALAAAKESEEDGDDEDGEDSPAHPSWGQRLTRWRHPDEDAGDEEDAQPARRGRTTFGGRPRPEVGRRNSHRHPRSKDDDGDDSL